MWLYGSWIFALWVRILLRRGVLDITLCDKVCQWLVATGSCFIQKIYAPSSSLLQDKYLSLSPSPLHLNIFCLFVILLLTQLYRYTPEIFLLSTATFKYNYRDPLRRIGQEYSANVAWWKFQSLKRIQPLPVCAGFFICIQNSLDRSYVTMPSWTSPLKCKVSL